MLSIKVSNPWIDLILHFRKALCRSWKDFRLFLFHLLSLHNCNMLRAKSLILIFICFKRNTSDDSNFKEIFTHELSFKWEDLVSCFQLDHVYYFYTEHKNWRTDRDWFVYIVELDVYCILWDILYSLWTRALFFLYVQYYTIFN